ncbi:hypothetical protein SRHO_G00291840 [Serrasalmus rhombeus]
MQIICCRTFLSDLHPGSIEDYRRWPGLQKWKRLGGDDKDGGEDRGHDRAVDFAQRAARKKCSGRFIDRSTASILVMRPTVSARSKTRAKKDVRQGSMAGVVHFSGWQASWDSKSLSDGQEPKSGRVYTMYHGTHINSARAIITGGFKPSTGGLLGQGVYVSRNIDKAKCYPLKADKREKVVFKMKVNVGKVKKIDCDNHPLQKSWHQNGYDCAWIPPKSNVSAIKSGREEDCVWDPSRITVVDVAVCMDDNKRRELRSLIRQQLRGAGCGLCGVDADGPHDVQDCWECGKRICPFEKQHVCLSA